MPLTGVLTEIFVKSLEAVRPDKLVKKCLARQGDCLVFGNHYHVLIQDVIVVGFGKAVSGMYTQVQDMVHDHICKGIISVPETLSKDLDSAGKQFLWPAQDERTIISEGAHNNMPDASAFKATEVIKALCSQAEKDDLIIALISGGGSALLSSPIPPLNIKEKCEITSLLASRGASIEELNTVRKSLSLVKGGKLAKLAYPTKVWSLILSDVVGNPTSSIASGPTIFADEMQYIKEAEEVVRKYNALRDMPESYHVAISHAKRLAQRNQRPYNMYGQVANAIIGSNALCVEEAMSQIRRLGYFTVSISCELQGRTRLLAAFYAKLLIYMRRCLADCRQPLKRERDALVEMLAKHGVSAEVGERFADDLDDALMRTSLDGTRGICVIGAGETTTFLCPEPGEGGRNQEMVLSFACKLKDEIPRDDRFEVGFLSCGTDGQDGPTSSAGAVVSSTELDGDDFDADDAARSLARNDSHGFFKRRGYGLIETGATGTNVMDIQLLAVKFQQ